MYQTPLYKWPCYRCTSIKEKIQDIFDFRDFYRCLNVVMIYEFMTILKFIKKVTILKYSKLAFK